MIVLLLSRKQNVGWLCCPSQLVVSLNNPNVLIGVVHCCGVMHAAIPVLTQNCLSVHVTAGSISLFRSSHANPLLNLALNIALTVVSNAVTNSCALFPR